VPAIEAKKIFCQEELRLLTDTLTLVARIASIYYPNEKGRLGNVFTDLLEIKRQVMALLELARLEILTQLRLREVSPAVMKNENNSQRIKPNLKNGYYYLAFPRLAPDFHQQEPDVLFSCLCLLSFSP
jgi:hypothetical protein